MKIISVLTLFLSAIIIVILVFLLKKDKIAFKAFLFWFFFWLLMPVFFIFPSFLDSVSRFFGMGNRMFFVFTTAILTLFILCFYMYIKMKQQELTMIKMAQILSIVSSKLDETRDRLNK